MRPQKYPGINADDRKPINNKAERCKKCQNKLMIKLVNGTDIDFHAYPRFSGRYYLRGNEETAIRQFFREPVIRFLESHDEIHVECHKNKLLFYKKRDLLDTDEIQNLIRLVENLMDITMQKPVAPLV